ncbi:MAG TPA: complex I NDUFA9 subunit family protein [Paenirhodobacter sp.]
MSRLVTIFGGAGFVGRYIARRLAQDGWRIRIACRRPNEALFIRPYGVVGQIEPVLCNIRDETSVRAAMQGADAVVNCVGILTGQGRNSFDAVHVQGAQLIARTASALGVDRLVHLSALGGAPNSDYARSKAQGEAAVLAAFPNAMILRPSVIFGPEDGFFNKFARMSVMSPLLAITGADTSFQPVYVDDVAQAAVMGVNGTARGAYDLGGPDVETLRTLMQRMLTTIDRKRSVVNLPWFIAAIVATAADTAQILSRGLFRNTLLSRDQLRNLQADSVVPLDAQGFAALGIIPTPMSAILADYLWRFRPNGQYDAIQASAKNLRKAS